MINPRTADDGRHVSLHQLIPNRFSQHCSERRVDDPHRVRSQTSLDTLSLKSTHPGRRQGSQPNRAKTRPDMHPHGVRVVPPRGWPKPCPRHSLQPVIGIRAHCPRLPRQWDPRRRLGQQNRQLLAGLGPRLDIPITELALPAALIATNPRRMVRQSRWSRIAALRWPDSSSLPTWPHSACSPPGSSRRARPAVRYCWGRCRCGITNVIGFGTSTCP
jgi:hypothetical protein